MIGKILALALGLIVGIFLGITMGEVIVSKALEFIIGIIG